MGCAPPCSRAQITRKPPVAFLQAFTRAALCGLYPKICLAFHLLTAGAPRASSAHSIPSLSNSNLIASVFSAICPAFQSVRCRTLPISIRFDLYVLRPNFSALHDEDLKGVSSALDRGIETFQSDFLCQKTACMCHLVPSVIRSSLSLSLLRTQFFSFCFPTFSPQRRSFPACFHLCLYSRAVLGSEEKLDRGVEVKQPIQQNAVGGKGVYLNMHQVKRKMTLGAFKQYANRKENLPPRADACFDTQAIRTALSPSSSLIFSRTPWSGDRFLTLLRVLCCAVNN